MADQTAPLPPHDGATGNLVQRAEPKVKAASLAALLTPLALYYLYRYVPGISALPHELDALVATLVTGAATFAAGFAARAVDRVDLFARPLEARAAAAVTRAGDDTIGASAVDELEAWTKRIATDVAVPVKTAAAAAVHAVEDAASAGRDPVAAARAELPRVTSAAATALEDGRAEATAALAPVVEQAVADAPTVVADVTAAGPTQKSADELMAELRKLIDGLDPAATPIADAAQAAAQVTAQREPVPVIPAPAAPVDPAPVTAPMAAVAAGPRTA